MESGLMLRLPRKPLGDSKSAAPVYDKLSGSNGQFMWAPPLHHQNRELAFQGEFDSPPSPPGTRTMKTCLCRLREGLRQVLLVQKDHLRSLAGYSHLGDGQERWLRCRTRQRRSF